MVAEVASLTLELSRQIQRERALKQFKYVKTCVLARELCLLVRTNRVAFNKEDVRTCCDFVSGLCRDAGCEASSLCAKAADAVKGSEEAYLKLCEQSCQKCDESRRPRRPKKPKPERTMYVT